jgi:hypothetical protein
MTFLIAISFSPCKAEKSYPFHGRVKRLTAKTAIQMPGRPFFDAPKTAFNRQTCARKQKIGLPHTQKADYPFQKKS